MSKRAAKFIVPVLLIAHSTVWAEDVLRDADASAGADSAEAATLALAVKQFSTAVHKWAQVWSAAVPWNQPRTSNPIDYKPVFLWATSTDPRFAGSSSDCNFPAASGQPVPGVSSPLKISVQSLPLPSGSNQIDAIRSRMVSVEVADTAGNIRLLPANFGSGVKGVFCASVTFNKPAAKQATIVTWFAPTASAGEQFRSLGGTKSGVVVDAAAKVKKNIVDTKTTPQGTVVIKGESYVVPK